MRFSFSAVVLACSASLLSAAEPTPIFTAEQVKFFDDSVQAKLIEQTSDLRLVIAQTLGRQAPPTGPFL